MNSLEITKCNNNGCIGAKANGEFAIVVLGIVLITGYAIYRHYEYKKAVEIATLNPIVYKRVA